MLETKEDVKKKAWVPNERAKIINPSEDIGVIWNAVWFTLFVEFS